MKTIENIRKKYADMLFEEKNTSVEVCTEYYDTLCENTQDGTFFWKDIDYENDDRVLKDDKGRSCSEEIGSVRNESE